MNYTILLNNQVKKYILEQTSAERNRLFQKFEYLETGYWDSGLKVKKLKGHSAKVIFEGRVDRGRRILFTLGKEDDQPELILIYVWGVVVHDDISSTARIIIPDNAPFLSFEELESAPSEEMEFALLAPEYFTQESINHPSEQENGPQQWFCVSEAEWQRMILFQRGEFELYLYLTKEQKQYLIQPLPFLLAGTAGSGKTTISVYNLFRSEFRYQKKIFITYNHFLKDFSHRIYQGLLNRVPENQVPSPPDFFTFRDLCYHILDSNDQKKFSGDKEIDVHRFLQLYQRHRFAGKFDWQLIWEEIRAILKGKKLFLNLQSFYHSILAIKSGYQQPKYLQPIKDTLEILQTSHLQKAVNGLIEKQFPDIDSFTDNFETICANQHKETVTLLLKIHERLLKNQNDFSCSIMSYAEYNTLGLKTAPNFPYNRKEIYDIAEYYQNFLSSENLWDEIDLTRAVLLKLTDHQGDDYLWELVIVDEVQDFTDLQLQLILKLARDPRQMLFAGDVKQTINPSGFRWETIKQSFYQRRIEAPEIQKLTINFRNTGDIVKLANALLNLKRRISTLQRYEYEEKWKFSGIPPKLLLGIPFEAIRKNLQLTAVKQTIITRDHTEQIKLKKLLNTELIFTISEAKGLEFDTVFLYNFCADKSTNKIWQKIVREEDALLHQALIDYEINLLYVAITRSRCNLIIWDEGDIAPVWQIPELRNLVVHAETTHDLELLWQNNSTPEEWQHYGDYLMLRRFYLQAAECYHNANLRIEEKKARIHYFESIGNTLELYDLYYEVGEYAKAGVGFEQLMRWEDAFLAYQSAGMTKPAKNAQAFLLMKSNQFESAAKIWESLKNYPLAFSSWKKTDNKLKCAELAWKTKNFEEAGFFFEAIRQYAKAAKAWKKINNHRKVTEMLLRSGRVVQAIQLAKRHRVTDSIHKILLEQKEYYHLALLLDLHHDPKCKKYFNLAIEQNQLRTPDLKSEGYRLISGNHFALAAICFALQKEWEKAGDCNCRVMDYDEAINCYIKAGLLIKAARIQEKQKRYLDAAFLFAEAYTGNLITLDKNVKRCLNQGINKKEKYGTRIIHQKTQEFMNDARYQAALQLGLYVNDHQLIKDCVRELKIPENDFIVLGLTRQYDKLYQMAIDNPSIFTISQAIYQIDKHYLQNKQPETAFWLIKLKLFYQSYFKENYYESDLLGLIAYLFRTYASFTHYFKPFALFCKHHQVWSSLVSIKSFYWKPENERADYIKFACTTADEFIRQQHNALAFFTGLIGDNKEAIVQSSMDPDGLHEIIQACSTLPDMYDLTIAFTLWNDQQLLPLVITISEKLNAYKLLGVTHWELDKFEEAGRYFMIGGEFYRALECWKLTGKHLVEKAHCFENLNAPLKSLKIYAKIQDWKRFCDLYQRLPEKTKATQGMKKIISMYPECHIYIPNSLTSKATVEEGIQHKLKFE